MSNEKGNGAAFDIGDIDAADEATMNVMVNGRDTGWVWVFAGPGHKKAIEQSNRLSREQLARDREAYEARANGRRVKQQEETPEENHDKSVLIVTERLIGWHMVDDAGNATGADVTMAGQPFPFTTENARLLLKDRKKAGLLLQALEFLNNESAFTKPSATK